MATKFNKILHFLITLIILALNSPWPRRVAAQVPYLTSSTPLPPLQCPSCLPPPTTDCPPPPPPTIADCPPPPPSAPLQPAYSPPPPGTIYSSPPPPPPPPPFFYPPPYWPYTPPLPFFAPPPPNPILPYFPFYFKNPPPPPNFSSSNWLTRPSITRAVLSSMILLRYLSL